MSRPVYIMRGNSDKVIDMRADIGDTVAMFGTDYHFHYPKNIKINGYITPNTQNVAQYGIDLGIVPTVNTKFELYIYNTGTNMGNGNENLGIIVHSGSPYGDTKDLRFFWADVPGIYFDMYNARVNTTAYNNSNYTNRIMKVECGRDSSRYAYMRLSRYSDNAQIYYGTSYCSASDNFVWDRATLCLETYHSNNYYMKWYLVRIYEGDEMIMELYPYNKPGYGWCWKDNISKNEFYTASQAPWLYTKTEETISIEPK